MGHTGFMTEPATSDHGNRSRNGRGKYTRDLAHADRDGRACLLISQGWTYQQVADELGYADRGSCWHAVRRTLADTARASGAEALRGQQLAEMAELRRRMWQVVEDPPPLVDRLGRVVRDDDGEPVPDAQAVTAAAAVIIRAAERVAKLRGLDAPRRTASVAMNMGDIEGIVKLAQGELDRLQDERTDDERRAQMIAATVEPPDVERPPAA
jgi:hypothetical protein